METASSSETVVIMSTPKMEAIYYTEAFGNYLTLMLEMKCSSETLVIASNLKMAVRWLRSLVAGL
jgi:hypothetical protein